ncbi:MAG: NAD(P)H-dependent oxidoreductase [Desulfohalobiaceae bacterium]|nr:NAD(P)H-dependent oxidoreductase [Desulfohalobiaceae bacterium]
MSAPRTIIAVNGSPHVGFGNTALMLEMLRPSIEAAAMAFEVINLADKEISYCIGCGLCLEKGRCWINDDQASIVRQLLQADGVILASPVYFHQVTAQMKTFLDRCLALGHKPRPAWKPGVSVCVSAGWGETATGHYLASVLRTFGAFNTGTLAAMAAGPGEFTGREAVEQKAEDVARDLIRAVQEGRRVPATDEDFQYYLFMSSLIQKHQQSIMRHDHQHWQEHGLYDGFEQYIQQETAQTPGTDYDEIRQAWIEEQKAALKNRKKQGPEKGSKKQTVQDFSSCEDLIRNMPNGFLADSSPDLRAVYEFEVSGAEAFTAHLRIADGNCTYHEGPAREPDLVIRTPAEIWLAVARGELDGQQAFIKGDYTAEGDLGLLMQLKTLFG